MTINPSLQVSKGNSNYVISKTQHLLLRHSMPVATSCHPGAIRSTAQFSGSFASNNSDMAGGHIEAERLQQSAKDPGNHKDCNEEEEVEKSYKENSAGNAQAAVRTS